MRVPSDRLASTVVARDAAGVVERTFAAALIFLTTLGPVYTVRFHLGGFLGPWEDDAWVRATFLAMYALATLALIITIGTGRARPASWRIAPIATLGFAAVVSVYWSVSPDPTAWRSTLFVGSLIAGIYLALRFDVPTLTILTAAACLAGVLAGTAMVVLRPSEGLMHRDGAYWAGIYFNRNSFAPVCAVAVLSLGVVAVAESGRARVVAIGGVLLSGFALVQTESRSAIAALVVCGCAAFVAAAAQFARRRGMPAGTAGLICGGFVTLGVLTSVALFGPIIRAIGIDPTLDNRTPLWNFVWMEIGLRRFRGYGFYAYWADPKSLTRAIGWLNWSPPTAHNGFLETGLGLGIPAMATLLVTVGWTMLDSARRVWRDLSAYGVWPLLLVIYFVLADLTESFVLPNQFLWILFVAVASTRLVADSDR